MDVSDPDPIRSQTCSMRFTAVLRSGQSMTSTSCCARKAVVSCAVWDAAFSWTHTKFRLKPAFARGNILSWRAWCSVGGWGFHSAPPVHSSHHDGCHLMPWLRSHGFHPWVGCTHLSVSPHYLRCTRPRPSLWNSVKRDLSMKTQGLQCPRSHFLCVLPHTRRRRLWSKVNVGHLAGHLEK